MVQSSPEKTLKALITSNYPKEFRIKSIESTDRGAHADCEFTKNGDVFTVRLVLPRTAPKGALPLLGRVFVGSTRVWTYRDTHLPERSWSEIHTRVNLLYYEGGYFQVHIEDKEDPRIVRVSNLADVSLSTVVEVLMKKYLAKRLGVKCRLSKLERQAIGDLSP